jgi:Cysteine-rich secretory protein family
MLLSARQRSPRRTFGKAIVLGAGSLMLAAGLVAWGAQPATGWNQGAAEATLWQLLNGARVNNGMAPLQQHGTLVSLARWRSRDMIERNYFSHTILGTGCEVYCYYDQNGLSYTWGGENIAWNSGRTDDYSPVRAHEQFMGSATHRANVLNPNFSHGGVGAWAADNVSFLGNVQSPRMYTELFMQAAGAAPPPPPPSGGGGGGSGGGGAVSAPAPAPAPAPAAQPPAPKPKAVEVSAPRRPVSSAGLDGIGTPIGRHTRADAAALVADDATTPRPTDGARRMAVAPGGMRVEAASTPEPGLLESILGMVGALFG